MARADGGVAATSFRAVIAEAGVKAVVEVPTQVTRAFAAFAEQGRVRAAVTINGQPLHAMLIPTRGGAHRLYVNAGVRSAAGIEVGDRVTLGLRALRGYDVDVPNDLAKRLAKARLRRHFDLSSASHRHELARLIEDARSPKNPGVRIERTLGHLRGERTQQPKPAQVDRPLWICPKCGHPFVTKNIYHSCARHELDDLFRDKPAHVRGLFGRFRAMVDERGPTTMIVYRDRVGFMVKVRFCGATPKRDHMEMAFWFTTRDEDPCFSKIEIITTNAHVHRTRVRSIEELNDGLRRWIDRAYRVGFREHLR